MIRINIIYEDDLSEIVLFQLLNQFAGKFSIENSYPGHGFGYLKTNIRGFNQASVVLPHLMLTDLDNYACPLELIGDWVNFPLHRNFIFRIAVREVESWLLADIKGLSAFLKVSEANFPLNPDVLYDPKRKLISLARKSKIRRIREELVPLSDNASIGPNYNGCLSEFVIGKWNIDEAKNRSQSLSRAFHRLEQFNY